MAFDPMSDLTLRLRQFAAERDWEQFHSPKNLAISLSVEAGEVLEHFQWLNNEDSQTLPRETRDQIALELADVLLYLLRLADRLEVNLLESAYQKLTLNGAKYPVSLARGRSTKYTDL